MSHILYILKNNFYQLVDCSIRHIQVPEYPFCRASLYQPRPHKRLAKSRRGWQKAPIYTYIERINKSFAILCHTHTHTVPQAVSLSLSPPSFYLFEMLPMSYQRENFFPLAQKSKEILKNFCFFLSLRCENSHGTSANNLCPWCDTIYTRKGVKAT